MPAVQMALAGWERAAPAFDPHNVSTIIERSEAARRRAFIRQQAQFASPHCACFAKANGPGEKKCLYKVLPEENGNEWNPVGVSLILPGTASKCHLFKNRAPRCPRTTPQTAQACGGLNIGEQREGMGSP